MVEIFILQNILQKMFFYYYYYFYFKTYDRLNEDFNYSLLILSVTGVLV